MSYNGFSKIKQRIKNGLVALLFTGTQIGFATAPFMSPTVLASPTKITAKTHQGQSSDLSYTSGNITEYKEGDSINFRFTLEATHGPTSGELEVRFTGDDSTCMFFDGSFLLGAITSTGPAPTVTTDGIPVATDFGTSNGEWVQKLDITYPTTFDHDTNETVVNYTLRLSDEAGECNGSSQHSRLNPSGGTVEQTGAQNVPVPANQIIELPEIFVEKWVDSDGDGVVDRKATAGEWSFSLDGGTPVATDANGNVTFINVTPDGNHTVTESNGPIGQEFLNGSGTNCTFQGAVATANVAAGTTAQDATCIFNNGIQLGSITIIKDAQPNDAQDFAFTATGTGVSNFSLDDDADPTLSNTKTFSDLQSGSYSFAETVPAGWDQISAICSDGSNVSNVQLAAGENITCTFTNVKRGHLIVQKTTNPAADPTVFTINASGSGTITGGGAGTVTDATDEDYEVTPGTYSVTETVPAGWSLTGNDCTNVVVVAGETKYCTLTNTKLAKLTIIKNALPNSLQDFGFTTTGSGLSAFTLDDDSGVTGADNTNSNMVTFSDLTPGAFSVTEAVVNGWDLDSLSCTGTTNYSRDGLTLNVNLAAGEEVTCTFTNAQRVSISGTKFIVDALGNPVMDPGDLDDNWTIQLLQDDIVVATTTTDSDGNYSFTDLLAGMYHIIELLKPGWTQISDAEGCASSYDVTLEPGANSTGNDFCNFQNGSISGFKWNDKNANDMVDDNEEKLNGWTIFIDENDNGNWDDGEPMDVTSGDGIYSFEDLAPGTYIVCEIQQSNWVQTFPNGDGCHTIVIDQSGETNQANFGNQGRGFILVVKNVDTDGDGTVDEQDVSDWTWGIDGSGDFTTGSNNSQNVAAGNYTVSEDQKDNYHVTASSCSDEDVPSEATTSLNVTVGVGETVTCTFTNTRDTATITIIKDAVPFEGETSDQAFNFTFEEENFTLSDNGVEGDNTKTFELVKTGESYNVTEETVEGWTLDSVECTDGEEVTELELRLLSLIDNSVTDIENGVTITPEAGQHITCVFTNTRDTGTLTVVKKLTPSTDDGKFNLLINDEVLASNVGDNGSTEPVTLPTGTYTASETAGTNTNLGDYESSFVCTSDDAVVQEGSGTTINQIEVAKDQDVVCTFYNNKGEVLGEEVAPPALVNTGSNILLTSFVSLLLIGAVSGLTVATRRTASMSL